MSELLQIVRKLAEPVSSFRWKVSYHVFYRISNMVMGLFVAQIMGKITQAISSGASFAEIWPLGAQAFFAVGISFVLFALFVLFRASYPLISVYASREIRRKVLESYFTKEVSIHTPTGKTLSIFENGITSWLTLTLRMMVDDPINIASFVIGFSYLVYASIGMLPIALGYMLVVSMLSIVLQKFVRPFNESRRKAKEHGGRVFVRAIMEKSTALMNGALGYETQRLAIASDRVVAATERASQITVPGYRIPQYLLDIIRIVTVLFFAYQVTRGNASIGDIVTTSIVFGLLDRYFQGILDSYQVYSEEYVTLSRLWGFLDSVPEFTHLTQGSPFVPKKGELRFEKVSYTYPLASKAAVTNFSFDFSAGRKTAIVGRSGAGKSTLVKLLLGLLEPTHGKVIVDGQDLSGIRLDSYFPFVGYLPQEPSVFDGTVRENLTYGITSNPDDSELASALRHARCDFVEAMNEGLDTEIGERGIRLSGGERQRLAIARVFLRNPEILVLDEPTSALDSFSEASITEALQELFRNKTVVVVAHRLQTVKEADTIVVLSPEWIVEQWTHASLLASGGEYSRMVDLQSGKILDGSRMEIA